MVSKQSQFNQISKNIKSIKIQGARNIAIAGFQAYKLSPTNSSKQKLLKLRATEPMLENILKIADELTEKQLINKLKQNQEIINKQTIKLIKQNSVVFTHCHSSTVIEILKLAKKKKKQFVVYTTEVEPLLQGRMTANDLAKAKIKVIVAPDLAAEQTMKKCDILLFGVDAFRKKGLANKIGTSTLCKLAKEFNIPRYACGISLKLSKKKIKLESRPSKEVWDTKNKQIQIINPAFDFVNKKLLSGVVSELGILSYTNFIKKAKLNLRRLLK